MGASCQSWYVAYVPHPTNHSKDIVVAATFERGGFGADRAAPFVRRMLAKLDLASRVQAVIFAYETGLVAPGASRQPERDLPDP